MITSIKNIRLKNQAFLTLLSHWAAYALLLLLPFSTFWAIGSPVAPGISLRYVTWGFYLSDIAVAVGLIAGMNLKRRWGASEFSGPLLGLSLLAFLTAPLAYAPALAAYKGLRWLIAFGVYLWFVQSTVPLERLVRVFVAGLCVQVGVGVAQVVLGGPLGLPGEVPLWLGGHAFALTYNPNVLAGYLVIGLLLSIPLLRDWSIRIAWLWLWVGLFLTYSRSAWLAIGLILPLLTLWFVWRQKERWRIIAVALFGLAIMLLLSRFVSTKELTIVQQSTRPMLNQVLALVSPNTDNSTAPNVQDLLILGLGGVESGRALMIKKALGVIAVRPLHGFGASNFPIVMLSTPRPSWLPAMFVHNVPLLLAAEVGLLGGGIWLSICLSGLFLLKEQWRTDNSWAIVTLCAWLALAVISWFDSYPWAINTGRLLTVMLLGLIARTLETKGNDSDALAPLREDIPEVTHA